jgi:hypothetical protein
MAARFERRIESCPLRLLAGIFQRQDFGVRHLSIPMDTSTDNPSVSDNESTHKGIGTCFSDGRGGQLQRPTHPLLVGRGRGGGLSFADSRHD